MSTHGVTAATASQTALKSERRAPGKRVAPKRNGRKPEWVSAGIEALEQRIAPASLLSPTTLIYTDSSGDKVTVTFSKGILNAGDVNKIFQFDHGKVDQHAVLHQQLQTIDLTGYRGAAAHLSITVGVTQMNGGTGQADVGYINASGIDLGNVTVKGDLGRIAAGDKVASTPALAKLAVGSMGIYGTSTQAAGGNLNSLINGTLTALTITGNLDGASLGVGGLGMPSAGKIGSIMVGGSIIGEAGSYSGSIRASGNIGTVTVLGDVRGGAGDNSGLIGTSGSMGTLMVHGNLTGGGGAGSGSLLSTGAMGDVTIGGNVTGGSKANSGNIGTASTLMSVTINGALQGGNGSTSGAVLSTGNMGAVTVTGGITGGAGGSSGEVASAGNIKSFMGGAITGGSSDHSGGIYAAGNLGNVTVDSLQAGAGTFSGSITAGGTLGDVTATGDISGQASNTAGSITSGGAMGNIMASAISGALLSSGGKMGNLTAYSITGAHISSGGNIGNIQTTDTIAQTGVTASGDIGTITAGTLNNLSTGLKPLMQVAVTTGGNGPTLPGTVVVRISTGTVYGIDGSTFHASGSIGKITSAGTTGSIHNSAFDAGQNIGDLALTGPVSGSLFVAGVDLGSGFAPDLTHAGDFDNTAAGGFGFGSVAGTAGNPASIGKITITPPPSQSGDSTFGISDSTFVAGVYGPDGNENFGTADGATVGGSAIGDVTAGALNHVALVSGALGKTTVTGIAQATYVASDANGNGIGDLNAGTATTAGTGISGSTFYSEVGMGNISVYSTGDGITGSKFLAAGSDIGTITAVTTDGTGASHAITASGFDAYGNIGDINATGHIAGSLFVAGVQLGTDFTSDLSGAGAADYGFGPSSPVNINYGNATHIGQITVVEPGGGVTPDAIVKKQSEVQTPEAAISHTSFLAGMQYINSPGGRGYDNARAGSSVGDITATLGLDTVFVDSGSIGNTTVNSGSVVNTTYGANDYNGTGIGSVTVYQYSFGQNGIDSSTFVSNAAMGTIDAEAVNSGGAITYSNFRAGGAGFGDITAVGVNGNNAVDNSIFTTIGNIMNINVTGVINASQFLAGVDLGGFFSGIQNAVSGASIGNVTVTGQVYATDIVASVLPYNSKTTYGNEKVLQDTNVGSGGSIGVVSLDTADSEPLVLVQAYSNAGETNGIEAATMVSASIGYNGAINVPLAGGGSEVHFGSGGFTFGGGDETVREITFNG